MGIPVPFKEVRNHKKEVDNPFDDYDTLLHWISHRINNHSTVGSQDYILFKNIEVTEEVSVQDRSNNL